MNEIKRSIILFSGVGIISSSIMTIYNHETINCYSNNSINQQANDLIVYDLSNLKTISPPKLIKVDNPSKVRREEMESSVWDNVVQAVKNCVQDAKIGIDFYFSLAKDHVGTILDSVTDLSKPGFKLYVFVFANQDSQYVSSYTDYIEVIMPSASPN